MKKIITLLIVLPLFCFGQMKRSTVDYIILKPLINDSLINEIIITDYYSLKAMRIEVFNKTNNLYKYWDENTEFETPLNVDYYKDNNEHCDSTIFLKEGLGNSVLIYENCNLIIKLKNNEIIKIIEGDIIIIY